MNEEVKDREDRQAPVSTALMTQASPDQMQANMDRMSAMLKLKRKFLNENLAPGIERDYAAIPGTDKLSLLKPGAEKLLDWHGYYATFALTAEKEDWDIGLFAYTYRCEIKQKGSNTLVADCEGDASSWESKYRFEWKYESELPKGVDKDTLVKKQFGRDDHTYFKYQTIVANAADKRNTIRKMAQKRALIGATVLATATSDLFAADVDPDDPEGDAGSRTGENAGGKGSGDTGEVISEKQGKRLYGIRMGKNIDNKTFKSWLKTHYGYDDDRKISKAHYDEIVKICESGTLTVPTAPAKPAADPAPAATSGKPATGGKISAAQTKDVFMLLNSFGKTEYEFKEWLAIAYPQMAGYGINDLLSADVDRIKESFTLYCQGESA